MNDREANWQYVHERDADLIRRDGMMCEAHPGLEFEHDPNCAGPGMSWSIEGKSAILALCEQVRGEQREVDAKIAEGKAERHAAVEMYSNDDADRGANIAAIEIAAAIRANDQDAKPKGK